MPPQTHDFDLGALRLSTGEGRRLSLAVPIEPLQLGGEEYAVEATAGGATACRCSSRSRA